MSTPSHDANRSLLMTVTGEPFQPVRLYYSVPSKHVATKALARLRCIEEDNHAKCWVWLYMEEAESLRFGRPRSEIPAEAHPIVIGRFRFPDKARMRLEVRSAERAVEAARFFAPFFGSGVVLTRVRLINRWFELQEAVAGLDRLDKLLDANVTRIDPPGAERATARAHTAAEKPAMRAVHTEEPKRRDVPLVEDFPIHPDDQTPDFRDLQMFLRLRTVRAYEHWQGNTEVTLRDVIRRAVDQLGSERGERRR